MSEKIEKKRLINIRNIGIMAHIDAGKTTTTERILYLCEKIHKIREVRGKGEDGKGATMDYMEQERERGITIQSAATTVYWKKYQINVIDTPGHVDFTAEVERSLRVLDGGIVVMDGKKGVETQTETVWRQANKYNIPRLVFINKMDGVENEERFSENLKSIQSKLKVKPLPVQFPIGAGQEFKGIVDIVEQKTYYYQAGDEKEQYEVKDIPSYLLEKTKNYRQSLLEGIGEILEKDQELVLKYLEESELSAEEIRKLLRQATLTGKYFLVFCGSAYKHVGINLLLDGVVNYLPSPFDVKEVVAFSLQDKKKMLVKYNDPLPCLALAFKIIFDDHNRRITFFRVYAGKVSIGSNIYNVSKRKEEKVSNLVRIHADKKEPINKVETGDIAAVVDLKYTVTGDTFGDRKNSLLLEAIDFAEPVISQAIEPETKKDQDKLWSALSNLKIQDPSFKYWVDRETRQIVIAGMGELHLEILIERLRREYKLNVNSKQRKVSYRETITKKIENVEAWYKKKTGGRGHDARIWITFEPNEKGKGFEFIDAKKGQDMSNRDAEEVKEGLEEALSSGLLLDYPLLDVKATLLGGRRHEVDTQPGDFKNAAILAFRGDGVEEKEKKIQELGVVLLEPIMQIEVITPKNYLGDILGNLGRQRATIENTIEKEDGGCVIAKAPLEKMLDYSSVLKSLTAGRGEYSMQFSHYQEVSDEVMNQIIKEKKIS